MLRMNETMFAEEAERCRQQALTYLGQPEAMFLLRVAREFDLLANRERPPSSEGLVAAIKGGISSF
jgi:hypothetical protein